MASEYVIRHSVCTEPAGETTHRPMDSLDDHLADALPKSAFGRLAYNIRGKSEIRLRRARSALSGIAMAAAAMLYSGKANAEVFEEKVNLGAPVNTAAAEIDPSISCDQTRLYYTTAFAGARDPRKIFVADYDAGTGQATNPRLFESTHPDFMDPNLAQSSLVEICDTNQLLYVQWQVDMRGPSFSNIMLAESSIPGGSIDRIRAVTELENINDDGPEIREHSPFGSGNYIAWVRECRYMDFWSCAPESIGVWEATRIDTNFDTPYQNARNMTEFFRLTDPDNNPTTQNGNVVSIWVSSDRLTAIAGIECMSTSDPSCRGLGDIDHVLVTRPTIDSPFDTTRPYFLNLPDNPYDVNSIWVDSGGKRMGDQFVFHSTDPTAVGAQGDSDIYLSQIPIPPCTSSIPAEVSNLRVAKVGSGAVCNSYDALQDPEGIADNLYVLDLRAMPRPITIDTVCHIPPANMDPVRIIERTYTPMLEGYIVTMSTCQGEGVGGNGTLGMPTINPTCGSLP